MSIPKLKFGYLSLLPPKLKLLTRVFDPSSISLSVLKFTLRPLSAGDVVIGANGSGLGLVKPLNSITSSIG